MSAESATVDSNKLAIADCIFAGSTNIIDTHCHYNLEPFWPDWQSHWQTAQQHGVVKTVVASINQETSARAVEIAQSDEDLFALVGVHPSEVEENEDYEWLAEYLQQSGVLGIGEIGLDYYWLKPDEKDQKIQQQKVGFLAQLEIARQYGGWLSLHIRDQQEPTDFVSDNAYWDVYEIMRQFDWSSQPFILHCVSGSPEYLKAMLGLGAYVGFDGNITYPKADKLRELMALVPADRLLIETDAPYLPPQSHRGKTCEPWMISQTAEFVNLSRNS